MKNFLYLFCALALIVKAHVVKASHNTNVPKATTTITINGVTQDLSANRSWTIATPNAPSFTNNPSRSLNTGYQISSIKNTRCSYTVTVSTALALLSLNSSGYAYLEISPNNSTWTTINSAGTTKTLSIAIAFGLNESTAYNIQGEVPAGYYARVRTTGTVSFTSGQEVLY